MLEAERKYMGETGTMHEKLNFHKFALGNGANEEEIKGKDG